MSDDTNKNECLGCKQIMGQMSWIFSYADQGGAVICPTCGTRHERHISSPVKGAQINSGD